MSTQYYIQAIGTPEQIDHDTLRTLLERAQQGDTLARDRVFNAYAHLAVNVAKSMWRADEDLDELIQTGNMAILYAIDHAKAERDDFQFAYYAAYCVRRAIGWHRKEQYSAAELHEAYMPATSTKPAQENPLHTTVVYTLLPCLTERQRTVIDWLYGITGEQYNGVEIAAKLGCTRKAIYQHRDLALKSMRRVAQQIVNPPQPNQCTIDECDRPATRKGMCTKHYVYYSRKAKKHASA